MENYIKCFQTCSKCLISMNFLLALICLLTTSIYYHNTNLIISEFLIYYEKLFGIIAIILSILLIINAMIGMYSIFMKSSKQLKFYHLCGFLMSLFTFSFSIIVFVQCSFYRNIYVDSELCHIDKEFSEFSKIYEKSRNYLCSEQCPCDIKTHLYENLTISPTGSIKIQQCFHVNNDFFDDIKFFNDLEAMETKYECSGMCEKAFLYTFSNINEGIPKYNCVYSIFRNLFHFYIIIGSVFIVNSFVLMIFAINSFFICYNHSHGKRDQSSYYELLTTP